MIAKKEKRTGYTAEMKKKTEQYSSGKNRKCRCDKRAEPLVTNRGNKQPV